MDARVDDVAAGEMDAAGDAVEQPRMVGRDDGDEGCAARGIVFGGDGQRRRAGLCQLLEVHHDDVLWLGDPVGIGELRADVLDQRRLLAEPFGDARLLRGHPFLAAVAGMAQAQALLGGVIELADQLALPRIPGARPDRADVDDGQQGQLAQALDRLDLLDEVGNRLPVGQVALLRGGREQQVIAHEPGDQLGLVGVEPQPRAQPPRDLGAEHRMVAAAALGDVVQQHRAIERAARADLVDDAVGQRVIALELTLLDPREQADRADRVLVHRIVVVHVELHLRVDPAEIGNEAAEHARLVEPAQDHLGIVAAGQQVDEQRVGARVLAGIGIDQPRVAADHAHGLGVDFQPFAVGNGKDLQQAHRVLLEPVVAQRLDLAAIDAIALHHARAGAEARQQPARLLGELLVELGQEQPGQVADDLRLQEEVLHEALDRALARTVGEVHPQRHFALEIEGQAVLGPVGDRVEVAAHRPEERFGAAEGAVFVLAQQADGDEFADVAHLVDVFADPVERVQVAQAALALLDVGLDDIAAVAQPLVPIIALGQLLGDELALGAGDDFGPEAAQGLFIKRLVAPDVAALEHGRADRQVGPAHAHHLAERAARMADLEAEVPEEIEDRLDHLLAPGGGLDRGEEGDVEVRMRRHLAAAIAAHGHDRQAFARRAVAGAIDVTDDVIVDDADDLVDQEGLGLGNVVPGRGLVGKAAGDLGPARSQRRPQQLDHAGPCGAAAAMFLNGCADRVGQPAPIDDGTLVGYPRCAHRAPLAPSQSCE